MPDMMAERRVAPRYPIILRVELREVSSKANLIGRTSDLSRTGCYVDTVRPFAAGTIIHVKLLHTRESFEATGTVKYVIPGLGMGVQFSQPIPEKQLAILDAWLEEAARLPV